MMVDKMFLLSAAMAGFILMATGPVTAQTFTTLYNFNQVTNDGTGPQGGLVLLGNTLYGTTSGGGANGSGTVFKINTDGNNYSIAYNFSAVDPITNGDGALPDAGLTLAGTTFYGTAPYGAASGDGAIFAFNTDGGFTNLYSFTNGPDKSEGVDGSRPHGGVVLSGDTLYGTAEIGGIWDVGTVFAVGTNGTDFTVLHSFNGTDGALPVAGLVISSNTVYGMTTTSGNIFSVNTDSMEFSNIYTFSSLINGTNGDGFAPQDGLILSGNTLYGTADLGGSSGDGTVFAINTDGTGFTNLHSFSGATDGAGPLGGLLLVGNALYGTTQAGGASGYGTVFEINTNGLGFTTLHAFNQSDGATPYAGLIYSGGVLYGTTYEGGSNSAGTVFALALAPAPPPLTIVQSGTNVILTWPATAIAFTLRCNTNLLCAAWSVVSTEPTIVNGLNTVTNSIYGTENFYQLTWQ